MIEIQWPDITGLEGRTIGIVLVHFRFICGGILPDARIRYVIEDLHRFADEPQCTDVIMFAIIQLHDLLCIRNCQR